MPRRGALRGTRPLRWSVDLSPAEFAYVEQARAVLRASRAELMVMLASDLHRRLTIEAPALAQARAVLDAEGTLLEEEDEAVGRDRVGRGGRRPAVRLLSVEDVARIHAMVRRQEGSAIRLNELLADGAESADADD